MAPIRGQLSRTDWAVLVSPKELQWRFNYDCYSTSSRRSNHLAAFHRWSYYGWLQEMVADG